MKRVSVGGSHISFSPDRQLIADTDHTHLLVFPATVETTTRPKVFRFPDSSVGIDYTVWSPDGKFMLFDRSNPQGGDINELRELE